MSARRSTGSADTDGRGEKISDEVAAAFTLTYATSHHALFDRAQLKAGETLLVLGAGVASVWPRSNSQDRGARRDRRWSSDDKLAAARQHGADD